MFIDPCGSLTIQHDVSSPVVNKLRHNLYVDDFLSGADSEAESCDLIRDSISILDQAGMSLSKWCTNSSTVAYLLEHEFGKFLTAHSVKLLGMCCLAEEDCSTLDCVGLPEGLVITKRVVMSYTFRVFDPLPSACCPRDGFRCGWLIWICFRRGKLSDVTFPLPGVTSSNCNWRTLEMLLVLDMGLVYTSELSCLMIPIHHCWSCLRLVWLLSRPRQCHVWNCWDLCCVCAWLISFVYKALKHPGVSISCWTDSMVAICWIRDSPSKWNYSVANRVGGIEDLTNSSAWFHCCGELNSAELVSRGSEVFWTSDKRCWFPGSPWIQLKLPVTLLCPM